MSIEAVFIDRDGVINRERKDYVKSWREFDLLPRSVSALVQLATLPCPIIIVTNQSCVGRGIVERVAIDDIHDTLLSQVESCGGRIDEIYVCPHHPDDGCMCRKPQPGLLFQAAQEFRLKLCNCVFIGDAISDYQAAQAAGCRSILVQSGRQGDDLARLLGDDNSTPVVPDLQAAVQLILAQC